MAKPPTLSLHTIDDLFTGRRCLRQLHTRLYGRWEEFGAHTFDKATAGDFIETPTNSLLAHRFLEHYRICRGYREEFRLHRPMIQQLYPGQTISHIESCAEPVMEIHRRSKAALDELLERGEGALLDVLLVVNGRLYALDFVSLSPSGLKVSFLKSDTKMKDSYYWEAAWVRHGLATAGYQPTELSVYLLNREYRKGDEEFFIEHRLRRRHKFMRLSMADEIEEMEEKLAGSLPECSSSRCALCKAVPHRDGNIHHLYRATGLLPRLRQQGITRIEDLDKADISLQQKLKACHWIQQRSLLENKEQLDIPRVREFLSSLEWPIYCLDFECFLEALPPWRSVGVWEHIPFLFSIHTMDRDLVPKKLGHYLISDGEDRREEIALQLLATLKKQGSILVYGISLERMVLWQLVRAFPALKEEMHALIERLLDLQIPFTDFAYYHPLQQGKTGLKTVLSLFTPDGYAKRRVSSGSEAFVGYYYLMHRDIDVPWDDYAQLVRNDPAGFFAELIEYCDTDSLALAQIVKALIEKSQPR